jgi:xylan 1,4-beta-xylosidase
MTITNPILRGFNPDPSILRVGEDYYIACSTFEWFPGVSIHHSRDLVHWELLTHPLARASQLDMRGNLDSGGVWAPCLSHDGRQFYLIYTNVRVWGEQQNFFDTPNYLVTAPSIEGPWSEPIYLNSSGFDPSLFHDDDGRTWLLNMRSDHRKGRNKFAGIMLQEYDAAGGRLLGAPQLIFSGTGLGVTEGPHIYRREGWYYLLTAEGGTSYQHAATLARARDIAGPYELHPENPLLTSADDPGLPLQKAGHASMVQTQGGQWYLAHLCGRPLDPPEAALRRCNLGRETALQAMMWGDDGWPRLGGGGHAPRVQVPAPDLPAQPFAPAAERDDFVGPQLGINWQTLRLPADESWLSLTARPGFLRLRGRESLRSRHEQSLVGRRLQAQRAVAETCLEAAPASYKHMAGLALLYDTNNWVYLRVSHDEQIGPCLGLATCDNGAYDEPLERELPVAGWERIYLRAEFAGVELRLSASPDGAGWQQVGPTFDAGKLSDDYCGGLGFTGTFICLCAQDLSDCSWQADFDYFSYREL